MLATSTRPAERTFGAWLAAALVAASILTTFVAAPAGAASPSVKSVPPARVVETRSGNPDFKTVDGMFQGTGAVAGGAVYAFTIAGRGGVPADAEAAFLNVVAVTPGGPGFLTVFPCGIAPPNAANVNYNGGDVAANAVFAKIGDGGQICVFTVAATHLVIDVNGFTPAGAGTKSVPPGRVVETRSGNPDFMTVDGLFQGTGAVAAGAVYAFTIAGRGGVPADAEAVFLNVVAVTPSGPGFLTVFPCGIAPPNAANVNYNGGDVAANAVFAKIGNGGQVCVFTLAATDLVIDINGYTAAGAGTQSAEPKRFLESRTGNPDFTTFDGMFQGQGRTPAGQVKAFTVRGRGDVPADAEAAFLNVVAVAPSGPGFLTVFPCGITPPNAANVNYNGGDVAANAVLSKIGAGGQVCIFTLAETDLVVDVNGYTPGSGSMVPIPPPDTDYNYLYETASEFAPYALNGKKYFGWDPCSAITYATNGGTAAQLAVLDQALAQVTAASGFQFQFIGVALGSLDPDGPNGIDPSTANGDAEAVFGFSTVAQTPDLAGGVVGIGGAGGGGNIQLLDGKFYLVKGGFAIIDLDDLTTADEQLSTFLHEIGHMIGLDHVPLPGGGPADDEVMRPVLDFPPQTTYGNGDKNGLYNLGTPQCTSGAMRVPQGGPSGQTLSIDVVATTGGGGH